MGWFDIGGMGKAIWGAVTRPFTPPPPPPAPPPPPVMQRDASRIQSGGVDRLRQTALIDPRHPGESPSLVSNNTGSLISNNTANLVHNNAGSFQRPWWQFW